MSSAYKALIVAFVGTLGLWGCAKSPANNGSAERIKALEAKLLKLEDDFRAVASARDQLRQKLTNVDDQRAHLQAQVTELTQVVKERDELRKQFIARTGERDALQVQFDQFRKGLRDLLGQAESATSPAFHQPVTSAASLPTSNKS
jgi:septal ring factor EnvC (AmiA/AmiB activator)